MPFQINDWVRIKKLNKVGRVLKELKAELYSVSIGDMQITCMEEDLEYSEPKRPKSDKSTLLINSSPITGRLGKNSKQLRTLDLHGLTVNQALEKIDHHLSQAVLQEVDAIDILHGHGTGKLKEAVAQHLATLKIVRSFTLLPENTGVTRVYL